MKKLLLSLLFIGSFLGILKAQETPPTVLKPVNSQFYINLIDSAIWHQKGRAPDGTNYGWERVARYSELRAATTGLVSSKADSARLYGTVLPAYGNITYNDARYVLKFGGNTIAGNQIFSNNITVNGTTTLGTVLAGIWNGTAIADSYIASAGTWNAKENALTFTYGLNRTSNTIKADSAVLKSKASALADYNILITALAGKQAAIAYTTENVANKATNLTSPDNTKYPTTLAVSNAIAAVALSGTGFVKIAGTTISYDNSTYLTANQTISFVPTGDVTGSTTGATTIAPSLTLATVNSTPGSYGDASHVATLTSNGKGLNTATGQTSIQIAESQVTNLPTDLSSKLYKDSLGYVSVNVASTGKIKIFVPSANTDAARGVALQGAFLFASANDAISIGAGKYLLTTQIALKDSQIVVNKGLIYHTNNTLNIFYLNNVSGVTIQGGTLQGSAPYSGTTNTEHGIYVTGSSSNNKFLDINFRNFKGTGVDGTTTWSGAPQYFTGSTISNCDFQYCYKAMYIVGEYWKVVNPTGTYNGTFIDNPGGNLNIVGGSTSLNDWGIIMDGSIFGNAGHGSIVGFQNTHNKKGAYYLKDLDIGVTITGGTVAGQYPYATTDSTIVIENSRGIKFNGPGMYSPMQIYLKGATPGYNFIYNPFFFFYAPAGGTPPVVYGTTAQKKYLRIQGGSTLDSLQSSLNTGIATVHGGTGKVSVEPYRLLAGGVNKLDSLAQIPIGTLNQILISNGTGALPSFVTSPYYKSGDNASFGTLGVSGLITSTMGNNSNIFLSQLATTGNQYFRLKNTGADMLFGFEGSSASLIAGATAYSSALTTANTTDLTLGTNQTAGLSINGTTQAIKLFSLGTGTVQATAGVLSVISDGRLKDAKGKFTNALGAIMNLKTPNYYTWKKSSGLPYSIKEFSLFANEVHSVLGEEFAPTQPIKKGETSAMYGMNDRALLSLTIQALQEANKKIDALQKLVSNKK